MRRHFFALFLAGIAAIAATGVTSPAAARQLEPNTRPNSSIESMRRAREILRAGIDALGGEPALRQIRTIARTMSGPRTDWAQGLRPGIPSSNHPVMVSLRDYTGGRFLEQFADTILGGQPISQRTVINGDSGFIANLVTHTFRRSSAASVPITRTRNLRRHPESLLIVAMSRPEQLRALPRVTIDGRRNDVITYSDTDGETITLYFDAATHRLLRTEQITDHATFGDSPVETLYDDYRKVGAVTLPHHYLDRIGGRPLQELTMISLAVNDSMPASMFATPADYALVTPTQQPGKLGEGVYLLRGGYASVAVVFSDYVVVLEGGSSSRATATQIAEVERIAPGKPIRYVVATHFHDDHIAGLRSYVLKDAAIIAPPNAVAPITSALTARHDLRPDPLSLSPRSPKFEIVRDRRVIEDATQRLEIYQIGPSPHAAEMLIAYVPQAGLLFEADVLDLTDGRPTPAGNDTRHLAATIEKLGLKVTQIVGVHGGLGTAAQLAESLQLAARKP